MSEVTTFPRHRARGSRHFLRTADVQAIGFEVGDDRFLYINDEKDIKAIMAFIIERKIKIVVEGEEHG